MTLLKTLLATALVAASLVSGAHAQDRTIKFAFQNQKDHPQAQGAQKFADLLAAKSGGKIQVKLFPGGTLGGRAGDGSRSRCYRSQPECDDRQPRASACVP